MQPSGGNVRQERKHFTDGKLIDKRAFSAVVITTFFVGGDGESINQSSRAPIPR